MIRAAVVLALVGLLSLAWFQSREFDPYSMGIGLFVGAPLLFLAIMLYVISVLRDLRRRKVL